MRARPQMWDSENMPMPSRKPAPGATNTQRSAGHPPIADPPDTGTLDTAPEPPAAQALLNTLMHASDALHACRVRIAAATGSAATILAYPGYGSTGWVRVLARVVLMRRSPRATNGTVRGWRSFMSVPVRGSHVEIEVDGVSHHVRADAGGLVDVVLECSLPPGWHSVVLRSQGAEAVDARVQVVDPESTFGIVSDIDDTVMVTALPRPLLALWNTLVLSERARTPTPGMAVLYDRVTVRHPGAPIMYLSTGAWNVAPALERFLSRNLYPDGVLLLTDWGPTRQHWFRDGRKHKLRNLARLAEEFPKVRWFLVGDDGQHDPEIYAEFVRRHPAQSAAVAIRELSAGEALLAGGRTHDDSPFSGHGAVPWLSAPDGAGLAKQLEERGLL